jgi:hypothetical protein
LCAPVLAALVALTGCARASADVGLQRLPARERPIARPAVDFFQGLEHRDAKQFCGAIVGRVGKRLVRVDPQACISDFKQGSFDGALGGQTLKRVVSAVAHHRKGSVHLVMHVKGRDRDSRLGVVRAFGRWRVPIPAPS